MSDSQWKIRDAKGEDLAFIYSTWGRSYRYDSPMGRSCKNSIFFPNYNRIIDNILAQPDTKIAVACDPLDENVFYGYMVSQPNVLHYAFTKEQFWNYGIAKSLFDHLGRPKYYSHKTFSCRPILDKFPELVFNPFLLFKQQEEINADN